MWIGRMRGEDRQSGSPFSYVDLEARVAGDHPLRAIRTIVDDALGELSGEFEALYSHLGRPSIPPERLLRALLLQGFYSIRSERLLMEQLDKDYRRNGQERYRTMTLAPAEFIRRFLLHVLPKGFHRIRHYGLLASTARRANIARVRALLAAPEPPPATRSDAQGHRHGANRPSPPCPSCGGRMIVVATFERGGGPRDPPQSEPGIRTEAA